MSTLNIGTTNNLSHFFTDSLKSLLADAYTLCLHSHNFHWNAIGNPLYSIFEDYYAELTAIDNHTSSALASDQITLYGTTSRILRSLNE